MKTEIPRGTTSIIDRHPLITTPDTLMPEAIALMSQIKSGCILVVAAREGAKLPLGILTEQDVVRLIAAQTDLIDLPISGVMHRQLVTIREEQVEDIMALTHLLREYKTCHFPVVSDRGDLIGLVTPQSMQNTFKPVDLFRLKQVQETIADSKPVVHTSGGTPLLEVIQLMSQQSSNCVVITQRNSNGDRCNHSFDRRLAVMNETIRTFFSEEVDWLQRVRRVLATATSEQFDYALEINGQCLWFAVNISPIAEDSVVWVARDISDRQIALQERNATDTALSQIHQNYIDLAQTLAKIGQIQEPSEISTPNQSRQQRILHLVNHGIHLTQGFFRKNM